MREVFVDTSGWVALKHKRDTFWEAATALHRSLLTAGARYVTSNFVLDESYTLLLQRAGHHVAVELGEEILGRKARTHLLLDARDAHVADVTVLHSYLPSNHPRRSRRVGWKSPMSAVR